MKNTFIKYVWSTAVLLFVFSCTDLDSELRGEFVGNIDDINLPGVQTGSGGTTSDALSGPYSQLRNSGTANHGGYFSVQGITSDEMLIGAKGGDWFDGGVLVQLHEHSYTPSHGFINGTWTQQYAAINSCNELLASELGAGETAQIKALRAYFYWRLLDLYGRVKLITVSDQDQPQSTRQEVFNFVESELLASLGITAVTADMDLSTSPLGAANNAYRINRFAALGFLSKLYLNAEVYTGTPRFSEAAWAASYIIDQGPYQLCGDGCTVPNLGKRPGVSSDPDNLEGFAAVFAPNNEGNPEHIFTVNYDEATGGGMNFSQMTLHYSSQFTWNLQDQPWNGYAALEDFYMSFDDNDERRAASFIVGPQLDSGGLTILDYATDDGELPLNYTPEINELQPNSLREAGARLGKFSFKQFGRPEMDNDFTILRLGELYLIRAEAMARANSDWSLALDDVNTVRARAGVSAWSSITPEMFLEERGREMFQESSRRTDLIRFGKYDDAWWEKPVSEDYKSVFPIPFEQIQASEGTLTQNPGY
ncbi:RagB/SusD family nutrient uptake outer membrane protein [Flavobacteriaceae bacterium]|nr:RagB/SusD family nutrient uptake outer membrane protein [Flavobacteriaceae bacterium]MDB9910823.1 RagB/SusD family nutrient uptake outer membrane protein [Flavobacteriaceae bacterium]